MSDKMKSSRRKPTGIAAPRLKDLPPDLDADLFVAMWNSTATLKALAERIGISASTCALYAARLREDGHNLKWFRKGRPRLLGL